MAYWTGLLGGEQPVLELPFDRPRPVRQSHRGAQFILELDIDLSQALRRVAQQEATAFALLLASFQALLYRYSGQADIRVGANRNRVETERLIGFFVNTQVLKADLDGRMGFDELLAQARQRARWRRTRTCRSSNWWRPCSRSAVLATTRCSGAVQLPERSPWQRPGIPLRRVTDGKRAVRQPDGAVRLDVGPDGRRAAFCAVFDYATDLFDASTVERLAGHWRNLLRGIVANPRQRLGELPLLDAPERRQTLSNGTRPSASTRCRAPAAAFRGAGAATAAGGCADPRRTSVELRRTECAGQSPGALPDRPWRWRDVPVGLALERSLDMLVGLLAILKAGGACRWTRRRQKSAWRISSTTVGYGCC